MERRTRELTIHSPVRPGGTRIRLGGTQPSAGRPDRTSGGVRRCRRGEVALRRGWRWAADRSVARLPGVLVQLAAADRAARGGGLSSGRARPARLQLVVAAGWRRGLLRRPAGGRRPRSHPGARRRVGTLGRSRLGRNRRLGHRDEPPGGGGPACHPQRGPSAAAQPGAAQPQSTPEALVLLLLPAPGAARAHCARPALALLPALPARRPPPVHAGGHRTLRRVVVTARRGSRDHQLLPRRGATVEASPGAAAPDPGAHPDHLGAPRSLPRPQASRARPRGRAQPRPRRAPARGLALGPPRRARARHTTAHRLLRPRPTNPKPPNVDELGPARWPP